MQVRSRMDGRNAGMTRKWIIYYSDCYYPQAYEFDNEIKANEKWEELKNRRKEDDPNYFDMDYFAEVIENNGHNPEEG